MRKNQYLGFKWSFDSIMCRCCYLYQSSRKTHLQLFSLCSRCWRRDQLGTVRKEMKSTTIEKKTDGDIQESFFPILYFLHTSLFFKNFHGIIYFSYVTFKKRMYLADHRPEEKSEEYTSSILRFYLFCGRIISSAKLIHTCWITYLFVSAPDLPHASVCFRLK